MGEVLPFRPGSNRQIDQELEELEDQARACELARLAPEVLADLDAERAEEPELERPRDDEGDS